MTEWIWNEDETEMFYQEISKFNYFNYCHVCNEVKSKQQVLLGKCDALHNVSCLISDYHCCDKCCKLKCLLDDYIYVFTRSYKYPEYSKACEILKNYIDKNEYTLELHCEMKQMYENLGTYIFTNGTKRKRSVTKKLYVAIWTSIRECISSFSRLYMVYVISS